MSMPRSAMARIASGFTYVFSVPALSASYRSAARARRKPSAIWLRAELCVQRNRTRVLGIVSLRALESVEKPRDDDAVAPLIVELAMAAVHADHPEPTALVQSQAGRVLRKDPGHDLPEAALGVGPTQRVQRDAACPAAPRGAGDVDGAFRDN